MANSILKGRFADQHIPMRIRFLVSAERYLNCQFPSGMNDGVAFPFFFFPLLLIENNYKWNVALLNWSVFTVGYSVLFPIFIGWIIGFTARKTLRFAEHKNLVDKESFLVYSFSLVVNIF